MPVQGAEAPLSGLIALLAAADALHTAAKSSTFTRTIIFAALVGEPWGFMGSRRLLWDMNQSAISTQGLQLSSIDTVRTAGSACMCPKVT
jgi:nicastrin